MDSNLVVDYTQWERGKDYPEFFDEVALSTISRGYLLQPREFPLCYILTNAFHFQEE